MARIFISHSSRDNTAARALFDWLKAEGFEHAFLDVDETEGLQPGAHWEHALYEALQRCQAVILLLTPQWLASKWCFAEFAIARSMGKRVFPVIVEALQGASVAAELQAVNLLADRDAKLRQLARELANVALTDGGGFAWDGSRVPYPGLAAFEADDAAVYFGRAPEVQAVAERLRARRTAGGPRVVAVLGASGAGKSSLVRAGVLPLLRRDRAAWCVLPPMRPGADPVRELARTLAEALTDGESRPALAHGIHARLQAAAHDPGAVLDELVEEVLARGPQHCSDTGLLITVDQAEELFTTTAAAQRLAFAQVLKALTERQGQRPLLLLLTMRSDLFGHWQVFEPALPRVDVFSLPALPGERLREIVEGPARVAGFQVEPALAAALAADAHGPDAMPLVAFALRELYLSTIGAGHATTLRVADYHRLGDAARRLTPLEAVVRDRAEGVLRDLALDAAALQALRAAFVERLTNIDDAGRFTRRPARWRDIPAAAQPALRAFVDARLLTSRTNDATSSPSDEVVLEVTHEALLRHWPLLAGWLAEETDWLAGRRQLEQALAQWQAARPPQQEAALLQGLLLRRAADWLTRRPAALSEAQRGFVQASIDRERQLMRRARQQRLALVSVLGGVLALSVALLQAARSGKALERDVQVQRLLRLATAALEGERADHALGLAAQAHRLAPDARTHSALLQAGLALSPWQHRALEPAATAASGSVAAPTVVVAVAPAAASSTNRTRWLVGDAAGTVRAIGDGVVAGDAPLLPEGASDKNRPQPALALAVTGNRGLDVIRGDGSWWRVRGGAPPQALWRGAALQWAALAPDGSSALVLTEAERALLRVSCGPDAGATGPQSCSVESLTLPEPAGAAAAWDRASQRAAVALADGRMAVFARAAVTPQLLGVAWPADARASRRVLSIASLATADMDVAGASPGSWLAGDAQGMLRRLGDTPADGSAPNAWFVPSGQALAPRRAASPGSRAFEAWPSPPSAPITRVSVAPDGRHVAAVCRLQRVCLWRIDGRGKLEARVVLTGHEAPIAALSWSADGRYLMSIDILASRLLWTAGASPAAVLEDAAGEVGAHPLSDVDVDPRGSRVAAVRADGAWFVWSLAPGEPDRPARLLQRSAPPPAGPPLPDAQRVRWHPDRPWLALAGLTGGAGLLQLDREPLRFHPVVDHEVRVESLLFAPDGRSLYGGTQGGQVWRSVLDLASGGAPRPPRALPTRHADAVLALATAPIGGTLVSADANGVVRVHAGSAKALVETERAVGEPISLDSLSLTADGRLGLGAGNHGDVFVFAMDSGSLLQRLETGAAMITHAAFSRDGHTIAAVDVQQRLHLWRTETTADASFQPMASVRITSVPGAAADNDELRLRGLRRLSWSADGRLAIATQSGHLLLLDPNADAWLARAAGLRP